MATSTDTTMQPLYLERDGMTRDHRGLWSDAWRRLVRNRLAMVGLIVLVVAGGIAFLAPYVDSIERYTPSAISGDNQLGPSSGHWFGTDQLGRDIWARTLEGVRVSIQIGVGTQVVVLALGLSFGVLAAFGGRFTDNIVMRFTDIMFSFPDLLWFILLRAILIERDIPLMTDIVVMILAIGLISWTTIARLVRGQMLSLAERDFVLAARALGASRWRIVVQHMVPNTLGPVIVAITFGIPAAIFAEASLSFIGLGVPPPTASLGNLISEGYKTIQRNVWNAVFPAGAVALLMLSFTFLGDGLRDALDPRTR
ncbi:MAG TPA: ABC transporter permease [Dehalococcoidia bacterium]|nr:ABC transporter permease [Dehalococcoidia bacterium]